MSTIELADWNDPDVQTVYKILCDPDLCTPPNREEHHEGWTARIIVAALRQQTKETE